VTDRQTDALKGCGLSNLPVERINTEFVHSAGLGILDFDSGSLSTQLQPDVPGGMSISRTD
jgi:hypothetical protein